MKKRTKRLLVFTLLGLVLIVCVIVFSGVTVSSRGDFYLDDDYREYYLYKMDIQLEPFLQIGVSGVRSGCRIWFLPGQKARLVDRIEADVRALLDDLAANNSDLVQGYEISEDFQDITIYLYMHETAREELEKRVDLGSLFESIRYRLELRDDLIYGYGNAPGYGVDITYKEAK